MFCSTGWSSACPRQRPPSRCGFEASSLDDAMTVLDADEIDLAVVQHAAGPHLRPLAMPEGPAARTPWSAPLDPSVSLAFKHFLAQAENERFGHVDAAPI